MAALLAACSTFSSMEGERGMGSVPFAGVALAGLVAGPATPGSVSSRPSRESEDACAGTFTSGALAAACFSGAYSVL